MRYRSNNGYGVPMVIRAPYGGGVHGALYHSQSVEAFFTHVPGPEGGRPIDAVRRPRPAALVDPRRRPGAVLRAQEDVPLGPRRRARHRLHGPARQGGRDPPGDADLGHRLRPDGALRARGGRPRGRGRASASRSSTCARSGRSTRETVLESVRKTGKCLIVYEDNRFGGYGAEVAAIVAEEAFDYLDGPVTRIAGPDVPGVPYNHVLEDWFMVSPEKIADGDPQAGGVLREGAWPTRVRAAVRAVQVDARAVRSEDARLGRLGAVVRRRHGARRPSATRRPGSARRASASATSATT